MLKFPHVTLDNRFGSSSFKANTLLRLNAMLKLEFHENFCPLILLVLIVNSTPLFDTFPTFLNAFKKPILGAKVAFNRRS
ncbi:hypothetical protein D3C78_1428780 [compost metagenome]